MNNKIIMFLLVWISSCGYHMGNLTPPGIETVSVPTFINTTLFRDFEFVLTPAVVDEILVKTSLNVVSEYQAQTVLRGKIVEVSLNSIIKNEDREATLIDVTITSEIEWVDLRTNREVIPKALVSHNFEVNFDRGENFADETADGFRDLARRIVHTMENSILFYKIR